ncbi:hypothetical protein GGS23DRAFT_498122 [Durotheca rogersii]|uniref:uncharacterized protein n=1 Tax=Durotheca rogersii TaxID=419775 RepID=UPI00221E5AF2|nr:uncharacterized protein GGS23DRAFT_498122 [Durotheca rogersii]KAI5864406.1 hypothetical protein GGS23DRAFT_498122 [Durotheca rogersii]
MLPQLGRQNRLAGVMGPASWALVAFCLLGHQVVFNGPASIGDLSDFSKKKKENARRMGEGETSWIRSLTVQVHFGRTRALPRNTCGVRVMMHLQKAVRGRKDTIPGSSVPRRYLGIRPSEESLTFPCPALPSTYEHEAPLPAMHHRVDGGTSKTPTMPAPGRAREKRSKHTHIHTFV